MRLNFGFFSGLIRAGPIRSDHLFFGFFLVEIRKILIINNI